MQQFTAEGHLRWDSLGEFMAIVVSLEHLAELNNNPKANILAETLDNAIEDLLKNGKSPMRKVGQLDNRGSHYYLAMYWANELAKQTTDTDMKTAFESIAAELENNESTIISELHNAQGAAQNIQGYYYPSTDFVFERMRPSKTLNTIIDNI